VSHTSDNVASNVDDQRQMFEEVMDVAKVRSWLVQRLVEEALELVKLEETEDVNRTGPEV
jgi:hypothetical protein